MLIPNIPVIFQNARFSTPLFFVVILLLNLSACGFKFSGTNLNRTGIPCILIQNNTKDYQLERKILEEQAKFVKDVNKKYQLTILDSKFYQQITSVSSNSVPRQYQLIVFVRYSVVSMGHGLKEAKYFSTSAMRQLTVNSNRILGSDFEKETIIKEIKQEIANTILNNLSAI